MEVRNRMADVVKLRCNACQDFLKMVIQHDWQTELYSIAKNAIESNKFADNYIAVFEKMRDVGIENYSVDDMDVSFIVQIVRFCGSIVSVRKQTKEAIGKLKDDRNATNHSNENEENEELYLRGLLSLCDLINFIRTVDRYEVSIPDEERVEYRRKYTAKIDELKNTLDEERIYLVQRTKQIDQDIQTILESKDRLQTWQQIIDLYEKQSLRTKDNFLRNLFVVRASDEGIKEAHRDAVDYYMLVEHNYLEGERRMEWLFDQDGHISVADAHAITDQITHYQWTNNTVTEGMLKMLKRLDSAGYPVEMTNNGVLWKKTKN